MKTLFFTTASVHNSILASQLEIIKNLNKEKSDLAVVFCNSSIDACWWMKEGKSLEGCIVCQSKLSKGFQDNQDIFNNIEYIYLKNESIEQQIDLKNYHSVADLLNYTYKNCKIGVGVVSSIVSLLRDKDFDVKENEQLVIKHLHTAMFIFDFLENYIKINKPKDIYFFNGRFSENYPILHLCKVNKINYFSYELTSQNKYTLVENTVVHDYLYHIKKVDLLWENLVDKQEGIEKANYWFENNRGGTFYQKNNTDSVFQKLDYVSGQEKGLLPVDFDSTKKNISIFISSVDEIYSIYPELCEKYDQIDAIKFLATYFSVKEEYIFYVRIHPNLKNINSAWMKKLFELDYQNLVIIPADSKINSYDLVIESDKVITFGSTMGIEATYWNKPSILYGEICFYNPNNVYQVTNLNDLILLVEKEILPKERENTFAYGYSRNVLGEDIDSFSLLSSLSYEDVSQWNTTMDKKGYFLINSYFLLRKYKFPTSLIPFKDILERKIIHSYIRKKI